MRMFKSFKNNEQGAVTVDWVVLTAAVVALAAGVAVVLVGAGGTDTGVVGKLKAAITKALP